MPRVARPSVREGTEITAAAVNAQFAAFTAATTDIDADNLREFAVDLPQLPDAAGESGDGVVFRRGASVQIGNGDLLHTSPVTVASYAGATFPSPHVVEDGAGNPTPLVLGASGWALAAGDVLRVYWDLSVRPRYTETGSAQSPGVLAPYGIELDVWGSPSTTTAGDGMFGWLMWLQWDITDNTLTNWVPVPSQSNFTAVIQPGVYGDELPKTAATTPIPPWIDYDEDQQRGQLDTLSVSLPIRWRGVSGAYYYVPTSGVTVYGLRLVIAGVAHAWNYNGVNYWRWAPTVADDGATYIEYTSGGLTALLHKGVV